MGIIPTKEQDLEEVPKCALRPSKYQWNSNIVYRCIQYSDVYIYIYIYDMYVTYNYVYVHIFKYTDVYRLYSYCPLILHEDLVRWCVANVARTYTCMYIYIYV